MHLAPSMYTWHPACIFIFTLFIVCKTLYCGGRQACIHPCSHCTDGVMEQCIPCLVLMAWCKTAAQLPPAAQGSLFAFASVAQCIRSSTLIHPARQQPRACIHCPCVLSHQQDFMPSCFHAQSPCAQCLCFALATTKGVAFGAIAIGSFACLNWPATIALQTKHVAPENMGAVTGALQVSCCCC